MTVRGTFVNSFPSPSHVKTSFYTDKIVFIEKQDLVPRQRTGDCSERGKDPSLRLLQGSL